MKSRVISRKNKCKALAKASKTCISTTIDWILILQFIHLTDITLAEELNILFIKPAEQMFHDCCPPGLYNQDFLLDFFIASIETKKQNWNSSIGIEFFQVQFMLKLSAFVSKTIIIKNPMKWKKSI